MKLIEKIFRCYILEFHDWTSKAMRNEPPNLPSNPSLTDLRLSLIDQTKMYCSLCGEESEVSKTFAKNIYNQINAK